ncbi:MULTISPECIES: hypothetical protein [Clostridium]|uniref:hypothetical protein n=1 Tax=Clostridium TaxID=1485 RepID=UPI00290324D0|nr:hypothetical protein [Clostridium sp.]MDU1937220.1 hypothetical protein [Clostridium sp.]MDU2045851.1 hypothetical protein [Clostridium sp.]
MKARRRVPGTNKAKENYLLAGIFRCGCCGRHYLIRRYHTYVEGINKNFQKKNKVEEKKKEVIPKEIKEIESQINNIVTAIASRFM